MNTLNETVIEQFRTLKLLRVHHNIIEPFNMVLIKFHDNDFGSTFQPLLESVLNYLSWNTCYEKPVPDTLIEQMIRDGIEYHYRYFQLASCCRYDLSDSRYNRIDSTIEYLNHIKILFNKDAEAVLHECDNGENWLLNISTAEVMTY